MKSRPLTSPCFDQNECPTSTPARLLIGRPLLAVPYSETPDTPHLTLIRRFQQSQQAMSFLWKRWFLDYLTPLSAEHERREIRDNVMSNDDNTSQIICPIAKIINVSNRIDHIARVDEI